MSIETLFIGLAWVATFAFLGIVAVSMFRDWRETFAAGRAPKEPVCGTVTLTITADTSRFTDAMLELRESTSVYKHRLALSRERNKARLHLAELIEDAERTLGLAGDIA